MVVQYQDFLLAEFHARRNRNPQYSLRAFARDVGMPASKLSQNLRGLCGISVVKARSIAARLEMSDRQKELFITMVESKHARSQVARQLAADSLKRLQEGTPAANEAKGFDMLNSGVQFFALRPAELAQLKRILSDCRRAGVQESSAAEDPEFTCVVGLQLKVAT